MLQGSNPASGWMGERRMGLICCISSHQRPSFTEQLSFLGAALFCQGLRR